MCYCQPMKKLILLVFSLLLLSGGLYTYASKPQDTPSEPSGSGTIKIFKDKLDAKKIIQLQNEYRESKGLSPLIENELLNASALAKAQDMLAKNYWSHVAPDGTEPWYFFDSVGYTYSKAGENLANGFNTNQAVVNGWINSPLHEENLSGDYTEIGVAYIDTTNYSGVFKTNTVVAHYGKQL